MKRSRRIAWWGVYIAGSAAVIGALGWVTTRVVHLQREEAQARGEIRRQELVRQALWRMDSWLSPRLARENARTWFEYESYYPQTMAFNRLLQPLNEGAVVLASPLLTFRSDFLPLHFQYREGSGFTSPQVPSAVYSSAELNGCSPVLPEPTHTQALQRMAHATDPADLRARLERAEALLAAALDEGMLPAPPALLDGKSEQVVPPAAQRTATKDPAAGGKMAPATKAWSKAQEEAAYDLKNRQSAGNAAQQVFRQEAQTEQGPGAGTASQAMLVGALVPVWLGDPPDQLLLARRVRTQKESMLQGVLVDWPKLRQELLHRVEDIMPGAQLRAVAAGAEVDPAVALAGLPVVLVPPANLGDDGTRTANAGLVGLGIVWLAALGALGTTGLALRSTIASAVQTSRFASSVTHELRTPLTTFRLYAEMLADGMVPEGTQRSAYLDTLRDESVRLGFLVENVLAWSRVEEGRATVEARRISAAELVSAAEAVLRRRCLEAGARFELELATEPIHTNADADRVRQVLFNLVDNACKYAGDGATIRLSAQHSGGSLVLAVDDDGPGVAPRLQGRIFRAFDRGERGPGDAVRGLGLGLAISRELARSLGGELRCVQSALGGARFELDLPVTS